MMRGSALLAVLAFCSIATGASAAAPVQPDISIAVLLRTACVDTGLRRETFEQTARSEHWRRIALRSRQPRGPGWDVAYRAGAYSVVLSRMETEGDDPDTSVASTCMVSTESPSADWRSEVESFASEQNLTAEPAVEIPGFDGRLATWSRFRDRTLTSAYRDEPKSLTVTLSRQVVTSVSQ